MPPLHGWLLLPAKVEPLARPGPASAVQAASSTAALDPAYKLALARTRQATAIHRAIGFLNTGSRARSALECY